MGRVALLRDVPGVEDACGRLRGSIIDRADGRPEQTYSHFDNVDSEVVASARQADAWTPLLRRLTPQVVVQAGRPRRHHKGPAAQERVRAASKRAECAVPGPRDHHITGL